MIDLKERKKFIGGTDAAKIMGMSQYGTPLSVWAEKTGAYDPEVPDNEAMMLGRELEDYVARRFERDTGKKVAVVSKAYRHPKYDFIGGNVDRKIVNEDAILECKTAGAWSAKKWEGDDIPKTYFIQVMHYMMITGAKMGYIAVLIGNQQFLWKPIPRDEKMIKAMIKKEVEFWTKYVVPKVMPAEIYSSDGDTLAGLYEGMTIDNPAIELDDEADKLIDVIEANKQDEKVLEETIKQNKNRLKAMLKENEAGYTSLHRVTWKEQANNRLDTAKLKKEKPEIYKKYIKKGADGKELKSRVLRISDNGGK